MRGYVYMILCNLYLLELLYDILHLNIQNSNIWSVQMPVTSSLFNLTVNNMEKKNKSGQ